MNVLGLVVDQYTIVSLYDIYVRMYMNVLVCNVCALRAQTDSLRLLRKLPISPLDGRRYSQDHELRSLPIRAYRPPNGC